MKSVAAKKSASHSNSVKKTTKLALVPTMPAPVEAPVSKRQAGDMDFLECQDQKPLSPVFAQFDRSYKSVHSMVGWPFAIV